MTTPHEVDWSALSPASLEAVRHVVFRQSAGYSLDEIALVLQHEQPTLRHLRPPTTGTFTKTWVSRVLADLRDDIERSSAAT